MAHGIVRRYRVPMYGRGPQFKAKEPDDNKDGYRKFKRREGQSAVFGGGGKAGLEMNLVGWILLSVSASVPVTLLLGLLTTLSWPFSLMMAAFVFAHAFLIMTAWMMHRKVPGKLLSLCLCWIPILIFVAINSM